jgi:hypothetical protein
MLLIAAGTPLAFAAGQLLILVPLMLYAWAPTPFYRPPFVGWLLVNR